MPLSSARTKRPCVPTAFLLGDRDVVAVRVFRDRHLMLVELDAADAVRDPRWRSAKLLRARVRKLRGNRGAKV